MFLDSGKEIARRIETLIAGEVAKPIRLAVAFWGSGADYKLQGPCQIVCDLESGACNPAVIRSLRRRDNCIVLKLSNLHAKVVIGSAGAVVSSANMSTNGLGAEGADASGTIEAGYFVEARLPDYKKIMTWFDSIWDRARVITDLDLAKAQERWEFRNREIPITASQEPALDLSHFDIGPFRLLEDHININAGYVLRSVKPDVFRQFQMALPDVEHRRLGMIATWTCHLILNRAGSPLEHSPSKGEGEGLATDEWIVSRFGTDKRDETITSVITLLNMTCRSPFFSADIRRAASQVLLACPWLEFDVPTKSST